MVIGLYVNVIAHFFFQHARSRSICTNLSPTCFTNAYIFICSLYLGANLLLKFFLTTQEVI